MTSEADYRSMVANVVAAHIDEIRGDLDRARFDLGLAKANVGECERRIASLEGLLAIAGAEAELPTQPSRLTLHDAMVQVLEDTPGGVRRAGDLAAEINNRGLYKMRDGRPVEVQQIHARVGNYGQLFKKEGTFIKLAR